MSSSIGQGARIHPLVRRGVVAPEGEARWSRGELAGRLVELSGRAATTVAVGLVLATQVERDPVAWITTRGAAFFPPDVDDYGVDLDALVVVRVGEASAVARAADRLARSGAFGLIVMDLRDPDARGRDKPVRVPTPLQGRLVGLAQKHDIALVCLTHEPADTPSLGSLVSLRAEALRLGRADGSAHLRTRLDVIKDKRRGPGWAAEERNHRGPAGLR